MRIPKAVEHLVESFERLPGIGPKSAQRLAFYLLHVPQDQLDDFASALTDLQRNTTLCKVCFNIGTTELCEVCSSSDRDREVVCVVEDALDVLAFEKSGKFKGLYHVLHGLIDPLNAIGPDDIYIPQLVGRLRDSELGVKEIIIATNPTMEGEATAMFVVKKVKDEELPVTITRIGHGLPVGADIEYADETTLGRALEGRKEY